MDYATYPHSIMSARLVSLYSTFSTGSGSQPAAQRLTDDGLESRLEEWKNSNGDEETKSEYGGSDISKDGVDVTTALMGVDGGDVGLGEPERKRRKGSWFSFTSDGKGKEIDLDAIATQPSVFDDPDLAAQYQPQPDWENIHRFDPTARWSWREEKTLVRKIDFRIMVWTCLMFCALEMDRANIKQAVTDNLLPELGLTTNGTAHAHLELGYRWTAC